MKRLLLLLTAAVLVIAGVAPISAAGRASAAVAAAGNDPNQPGASRLASCIQSNDSLSALFLLDRSGSLDTTDNSGIRYDGLAAGLGILTDLAENAGVVVEAAIASFDNLYYEASSVVGWTQLGGDTAQETINTMVDAARAATQPNGGTDFSAALAGAREDMADRAGRNNCRVVLWFTDGLDESGNLSSVCTPGGIADELRSDDITLISLHLTEQLSPDELDQLPAITLGSSAGLDCGTVPVPEGSSPGVYLSASDPAGLVGLFQKVVNIVEGCTETGALGTVIDPGIRSVRIDIQADQSVPSVRLDGPGGEVIVAPAQGNYTQDGYSFRSTETNGYVSMLVELPQGKGVGKWIVTPTGVPITPDRIGFCVSPGITLVLDEGTAAGLFAGSESTLGVIANSPEGAPVDLSVFATAVPSASVTSAQALPIPATAALPDPAAGTIDVSFTAATNDARAEADVALSLTTASGLQLRDITGQWPLELNLSAEFPVLTPRNELVLTDAVHEDPAVGQLIATGSPLGPTQVCLDAMVGIVLPSDASNSAIDYSTGCIDLGPREQREITVTVIPEVATVGAGSGAIPVELLAVPKPDGSRNAAPFDLPVTWRFTNPIAVTTLLWVLVLVTALALLLPLLAVYLANWLTARFDVGGLRWASIPVVLSSGQPQRTADLENPVEGLTLLDPAEFKPLNPPRSRRSRAPGLWGRKMVRAFSLPTGRGSIRFESEVTRSPFRYPRFHVLAPANARLVTSEDAMVLESGAGGTASGGLEFLVVLVIPDNELRKREAAGELVVLTREAISNFASLEQRVRHALPWGSVVEDLRLIVGDDGKTGASRGAEQELPPAFGDDDGDTGYELRNPLL